MQPSLARGTKGRNQGRSEWCLNAEGENNKVEAQTARSWGGLDRTSLPSFSSRSMMVL